MKAALPGAYTPHLTDEFLPTRLVRVAPAEGTSCRTFKTLQENRNSAEPSIFTWLRILPIIGSIEVISQLFPSI